MPSLKTIHSLQGCIAAAASFLACRTSAWLRACVLTLICASALLTASAQTFTTLTNFEDYPTGAAPLYVTLVQGLDGNFYGTTAGGGIDAYDEGTVFRVTPEGTLTTLYSFCSEADCNTNGYFPFSGLALGKDGNFYGTTRNGGTSGLNCPAGDCGTVFRITPEGILSTLYSFTGNDDGSGSISPLILGRDGNFYGTTPNGGAYGYGTLFKITATGLLTTLYSFSETDGYVTAGALLQGSDGNFYGTIYYSPITFVRGSVYRITPAGTYTTLYKFCSLSDCADGSYPDSGLIQGTDGNLYGTTAFGGNPITCVSSGGCGTVFRLTLQGTLTTLHSFTGPDGQYIVDPVIQATDGNFYGMSLTGGTGTCVYNGIPGCGTIYQITPAGVLTTLHYFTKTDSGNTDYGGLLQGTNGILYGTTEYGGIYEYGTVFSLSVGLGQFVETNPTSGKLGAVVRILGSFLTGATSVTFNGTAATFTVNSKSEITTTVPTGATTGTVQVITPRLGTLSSNVPFRVTP
jgi:uncharacterized repeat protein (TIGR03803 family)